MGKAMKVLLMLCMVGYLASVAFAIRVNDDNGAEEGGANGEGGASGIGNGGSTGTASVYDPPYSPNQCYGDDPLTTTLVATVSEALWAGGDNCKKTLRVRCIKSSDASKPCKLHTSVDVKVADYCPDCGITFQISDDAYAKIADPAAPSLQVGYTWV
ncbi:EG45-like domain containing protein [Jatropha curcas]|nr:EG45-like domain containing protein [Jatropha curcas]